MSERLKTVLLFGAPGVGKGTQGKILGNVPGFYHCASGDVFRRIDKNSDLGRTFLEYSSRGELVPDDVTIRMWHAAIQAHIILSNYRPHADMLVLDGIPRTPHQVDLMGEHIEVLKIVHLTCTDVEALVERLRQRAVKEKRHDDADEKVIRHRWDVYEQETRPVLEKYPDGRVVDVTAIGSPAGVFAEVLSILAPVQSEHFAQFDG